MTTTCSPTSILNCTEIVRGDHRDYDPSGRRCGLPATHRREIRYPGTPGITSDLIEEQRYCCKHAAQAAYNLGADNDLIVLAIQDGV